MNCRDFREIADTYLSDELLVETNHEVFQHLESCAVCRQELSFRREVREKLRLSLKTSNEFQLNPMFAQRLQANLKEEAFRQTSWFSWKNLTPLVASLLVIASLTVTLLYRQKQTAQSYLVEISKKALNRHEDCGLKHVTEWEANAGKISAEKISFVKSLQSNDTEILEAHECEFEGKHFTHYILRRGKKIVSVLKNTSENELQTNTKAETSITCEKEKGLQMASFKNGEDLIFVISDMSEAENLSLARTLSDNL